MKINVRLSKSGFAELTVDEISAIVFKGKEADEMIEHLREIISEIELLNN